MRGVHSGARRQICVALALAAAQHRRTALKSVRLASPSTIETNKAIRPAQLFQVIGAGSIRGENLLKLWQAGREAAAVHLICEQDAQLQVVVPIINGLEPDRHA